MRRIVVAVFFLAACTTGIEAREHVLMPILAVSYEKVVLPLALEAMAPEDEALRARAEGFLDDLVSRDRRRVTLEIWLIVRGYALAGIDLRLEAGTLGLNGARILRENIHQMHLNVQRLLSR